MVNNNIVWEGNKEKHLSKNPLLRFLLRKFNRDVVKMVSLCSPKTILDVGCGEGFTTRAIADAFPDARVRAIDGEQEYVIYALRHSRRPNISYAREDLYALDVPSIPLYDCVVANELLEHLEDAPGVLERLTRLSRRFVVVSVPNEPWFQIANFLRGKYLLTFGNTPGHINHWTRKGLRDFASGYGIVVRLETSGFWNIVLFERQSGSRESKETPPAAVGRYRQIFFSRNFLHYFWTGGAVTVTQVALLWFFIDVMRIPTIISSIIVVGGLFFLRYLILFSLRVIK